MNEHEFPLMATLVTNAVIQREQSKSNYINELKSSQIGRQR